MLLLSLKLTVMCITSTLARSGPIGLNAPADPPTFSFPPSAVTLTLFSSPLFCSPPLRDPSINTFQTSRGRLALVMCCYLFFFFFFLFHCTLRREKKFAKRRLIFFLECLVCSCVFSTLFQLPLLGFDPFLCGNPQMFAAYVSLRSSIASCCDLRFYTCHNT